jgi:hypothetical protein
MSLATVIRLEFAYPGVGILAGDSLQYLSIATAHGVIMVFFMIMPAIFGAFGNFLLPTQLGVHDVAFPRLNSAAFWFLPGGLIMLFQLVCTDRRYARMNCFNIRELQGILKRKFFSDLVNSHEHKDLLEKSMIGLRYKTNSNINLDPDMLSFYNFGVHNASVNKFLLYKKESIPQFKTTNAVDSYFISLFLLDNYSLSYSNILLNLRATCYDVVFLFSNFSPFFFINIPSLSSLSNLIISNFSFNFNLNSPISNYNFGLIQGNKSPLPYRVNDINPIITDSSYSESSTSQRFIRFNNPLINYDYKTGHYIGNWDKQYPYLINSFIEVARGIRKPS